jgi:hypothetical protein
MLKMQVDPEKCMKTNGIMTYCPIETAIFCTKLQHLRGIVRVLCPTIDVVATLRRHFGELNAPVRLVQDPPGGCWAGVQM